MANDKFQVGDKIKAGPFTADLGLTPGNVYTVRHVDDFGLVQPDGSRHHHYHPSHFELVERAAPDETYCLKDCEGDWHVSTESAEDGFRMITPYGPSVLTRSVERLVDTYGIDAAETRYCLLDGDGHWWVSRDGKGFVTAREVEEYGDEAYEDDPETIEMIDRDYGIDSAGRTTLYAKPGQIYYAPLDESEPVGNMPESPLADWERELLEDKELEADERIIAWRRLADHPIFKDCYPEERPLIEAMMAKLDRIYSEGYEGTDVEFGEPELPTHDSLGRALTRMAEQFSIAGEAAGKAMGEFLRAVADEREEDAA